MKGADPTRAVPKVTEIFVSACGQNNEIFSLLKWPSHIQMQLRVDGHEGSHVPAPSEFRKLLNGADAKTPESENTSDVRLG